MAVRSSCRRPRLLLTVVLGFERDANVAFGVRSLSSSAGLTSILSLHEREKKIKEEKRQSSKFQTNPDPGKERIVQRPKDSPRWSLSRIFNDQPSSPRPKESSPYMNRTQIDPSPVEQGTYDDRWRRLLNPRKLNGTNRSQPHRLPEKTSRPEPKPSGPSKTILISEGITTKQLSQKLGVSVSDLEGVLTSLGESPGSIEDTISLDAAELAAGEFGVLIKTTTPSEPANGITVSRPPVVAVMGHVDHGKTTLLDALRNTNVAAGEAGGITQHIGAFEIQFESSGETLTFLDTPGHAAFSSMRARGAQATDLVVLVVAADDGVMPQTKESLRMIREAGCQFVVAVTKCDLPQANPEKVKSQLAVEGVELEVFGGTVQAVEVAAPVGKGLRDLQEALLLQATAVDLKARSDVPATGVVVEANKNRGLGPVATVIVTGGTLRMGEPVVVGHHWGKIRHLKLPDGRSIEEVSPGRPVEISGLRGVPQPGDELMVVCDEDRAKRVSYARLQRNAIALSRELLPSESRVVSFVVKTDTQGTGEAVKKAVEGLASHVISPEVIYSGVGNVSEADVTFAEATNAQILAFNVRVLSHEIADLAHHKSVQIHQHNVIYHLLDAVGKALLDNAPLCEEEEVKGQALVQKIFTIKTKRSKTGLTVAGCVVQSGHVQRSDVVYKVLRDDQVVFQGQCASLKRHKLDVDRVGKGTECGIILESFSDVQEGDMIQAVEVRSRPPKTEKVHGGGIKVIEEPNQN